MKRILALLSALMLTLSLCACKSDGEKSESKGGSSKISVDEIDIDGMDLEFTDNDLKTDYPEDEITEAEAENGIVTVSSDGIYRVTGSLSQIIVNAPKNAKPHIILENAQISNEDGPAIYVKQADKVFITVPEGTESTLEDGKEYDTDYGNADGVIFSKADLTVNGAGKLGINGNYKCGIASKDDLMIYKTEISVNSVGAAVEGKDCVKIKDAAITVAQCTDAVKSLNSEKKTEGFIYVESGSFDLTAQNDAVQAETALLINGGSFKLKTGGGSANSSDNYGKQDNTWGRWGGESESKGSESTESAKGLKSGIYTRISGGEFSIDSSDDAVHSNGSTEINAGSFEISSGDDGIHSDDKLVLNGGDIKITKSYEGIEATEITFNGGSFDITAEDDGINAAGGNDSSSLGERPGQNPFESDSEAQIYINGGYLLVNASGDGIDSNGDITMNGGTLLVSGPENGGNGALDCGGTAVINGGTAVVTGSSDMAVTFSSDSKQASFMYNTDDYIDGGESVCAVYGDRVIASFLPAKKYNSIVISTPELKVNKTYTLNIGGSVTECDGNGFTENGSLNGSTESYEIKLDSVSTAFGASSGMGGGMNPGMGGGKPDMPDDKNPGENKPSGEMPDGTAPDKKPDRKPDGEAEKTDADSLRYS